MEIADFRDKKKMAMKALIKQDLWATSSLLKYSTWLIVTFITFISCAYFTATVLTSDYNRSKKPWIDYTVFLAQSKICIFL